MRCLPSLMHQDQAQGQQAEKSGRRQAERRAAATLQEHPLQTLLRCEMHAALRHQTAMANP